MKVKKEFKGFEAIKMSEQERSKWLLEIIKRAELDCELLDEEDAQWYIDHGFPEEDARWCKDHSLYPSPKHSKLTITYEIEE